LGVTFYDGLWQLVEEWDREEYSYGYLIPPVCAWLVWQKRGELAKIPRRGSWAGVGLVLSGIVLALFGELSTIYLVIHYAFIVTIGGIALAAVGWRGLRVLFAPLAYLVFMVPLPPFLYNNLSLKMQLISSELGVAVIRVLGISVFLEGNVIDLGVYELQVAEACNGLRYLFPLMSFGYLVGYLYNGPWWHKAVLFLSAGPITIVINSVRIGMTGVLVEHAGVEAAEGFLHLFEGWVIFMWGLGMLFGVMWLLSLVRPRSRFASGMMRLELLRPRRVTIEPEAWRFSRPSLAAIGLLVVAATGLSALPARSEIVPEHKSLAAFPLRIGDWRGEHEPVKPKVVDRLQLDDYVLANYMRPQEMAPVYFYVAYYASQRKGASAHSPRSCIPGGGFEIKEIRETTLDGIAGESGPLAVNRVIIAKGTVKLLVYYWFQQRGRQLTSEYVVKWMIFWDSLTRNRTDGALVRVMTPVADGDDDLAAADRRLVDFLRAAYPKVSAYVPS
jgi:exosortase D (VPLPA-CTERM-specific)